MVVLCAWRNTDAGAYSSVFGGDDPDDTLISVYHQDHLLQTQNYKLQRQCFSMHKGRPLVKPMVITTTSGYILAVLGPFLGNCSNNDAQITKHILNNNTEDLLDFLKMEDVMIFDRGFREVLDSVEEAGLCPIER